MLRCALSPPRRTASSTSGGLRACGFTPGQVETLIRHDELHRLSPGTYLVDPYLYVDVPLRARVRAAQLQHGPRSVACLDTAARLWGVQGLTPTARALDAPVQLALPPELARHQPRDSSVRLHFVQLEPPDVVTRDGLRLTTVERTLTGLVPTLDRDHGVSVLDSALQQRLVRHEQLPVMLGWLAGRRGAVQARTSFALADGRAESPLETRIRLRCVDADLAPETLQWPVRSPSGLILGYADLAWPSHRTIAEGDGAAVHGAPQALYRDRIRQNDLLVTAADRIVVVRFTWADCYRGSYVAAQVRAALAAAA